MGLLRFFKKTEVQWILYKKIQIFFQTKNSTFTSFCWWGIL